jgi:hypothetical protein
LKDNGADPDRLPPAPPAESSSGITGKIVILVIVLLGTAAGLFASLYWSRPDHAVTGSFTQIHAAFLRGPKEKAKRLLAAKIVMDGRELTPDEFVATYTIPTETDRVQVLPCPSTPEHWVLTMKERRYCFLKEGKSWKLHWIQNQACSCK